MVNVKQETHYCMFCFNTIPKAEDIMCAECEAEHDKIVDEAYENDIDRLLP